MRLPKAIVQKEVENLKALGVKIQTNMVIGRVLTIEELKTEYGFEAVFIGSGAGLPNFMGIPGESYKGVYSANEFLTRANLMKAYKADGTTPVQKSEKTVVVGGGNVAMDAARTALRLGANKVYIIQNIDRKMPLEDIADSKGLEMEELIDEIESIVFSGTKLNLDYYIEQALDEDVVEEIYDYFMEEAESDSLEAAMEDLSSDFDELEVRLVRLKFLCEVAN